jgi:voltage-gated sodium channel
VRPGVERAVTAAILANTAVLVRSYLDHAHEPITEHLHVAFLLLFVAELAWRWRAAGRRFWRSPWNCFDAGVVLLALLPVLGVGVTLLRVARLAPALRHVSRLRLADLLRRRRAVVDT